MAGSPMSELRSVWKVACSLLRVAVWTVGTMILGALAVRRAVQLLSCVPAVLADMRPCGRGHDVPMYGVYACACGALHEGWAFARCQVCGLSAGWTPCLSCGLPVRNPLLF